MTIVAMVAVRPDPAKEKWERVRVMPFKWFPWRRNYKSDSMTVNIFNGYANNAKVVQADKVVNEKSTSEACLFVSGEVYIEQVDPAVLQVHPAVLPDRETGSHTILTPYLWRAHDYELRNHLKAALDGHTSVLTMITGGSSVGKTRTLYEAVYDLAPKRAILRPKSANDLLNLLNGGFVNEKVVLWLNEAQHFFQGTGSNEAAAALKDLLMQRAGIVAVGTLWTIPHWEKFSRAGTSGDPHGQVRELLMCPATVQISVPDHLSDSEQGEWWRLAAANADRRMAEALEAGSSDLGRVVQHLTGGPELLKAYLDGPGFFTRVEHALLTTAIFARCLGHEAPFTASFLAQATDGVLDPRERPVEADWACTALTSLTKGHRPNGEHVHVRSTLTALRTFVHYGGSETLYELDDYLEQHTRDHFADQLASPSLWQALLDHTTNPDDLRELAEAASYDGLLKHAIRLYRKAVMAKAPIALSGMVSLLSQETDPNQMGAFWAVSCVDITDPYEVASVLKEFRNIGFKEAVDELMQREPAAYVSLDDFSHVSDLLKELREAQKRAEVAHLAGRLVMCKEFPDPSVIPGIVSELLESEQQEVADTLAKYAAAHSDLACPYAVVGLLYLFRGNAYEEEIVLLMSRNPASQVDLTNPAFVTYLLNVFSEFGYEKDICKLISRDPVAHVDLSNSFSVALLMDFLVRNGWPDEARHLVGRYPSQIPKIIWFDSTDVPESSGAVESGESEKLEKSFSGSYSPASGTWAEVYGCEFDGSLASSWEWADLLSP